MIDRKTLAAIKPSTDGRTHFIPDGAVGGLGVLWGAKGRPAWTLAYRVNGRQIRTKLGFAWTGRPDETPPGWLTIDAARKEAYRLKEAAAMGLPVVHAFHAPAARKATTLIDAIEAYLADPNVARLRTRVDMERYLLRDLAPLHPRPLADITRADIRTVLDAKGATHAGNRLHGYLGTMWRWLIDRDMAATSPVPSARPLKQEDKRDRWLDDNELAAVWRATNGRPGPKQAIVRLLVLTGQRREEVANMRWAELDELALTGGTWTLPAERSKNGQGHIVPLSPAAVAIILSQPRIVDSEFVFTYGGRRAADMSAEGTALKALTPDLADWRLHDLRRSFATGMQRLGVDPKIIDRCQNHVAVKGVGAVYMRHEFLAERTAAMILWSEHVEKLISG